jgi:hypothetical protein
MLVRGDFRRKAGESRGRPAACCYRPSGSSAHDKASLYGIVGISLMSIAPSTNVPPLSSADRAGGTRLPAGAKMIDPSSLTGGIAVAPQPRLPLTLAPAGGGVPHACTHTPTCSNSAQPEGNMTSRAEGKCCNYNCTYTSVTDYEAVPFIRHRGERRGPRPLRADCAAPSRGPGLF